MSAKHWATPTASAPFQFSWLERSHRFLANPVAEIEDETIDDQERRGDRRRGERIAQELAKHGADQDRRNGREDHEEESPSVRLRGGVRRADERAQKAQPVAPEEGEERDRRPRCMTTR